jgi:hypothetical protein
MLKNQKKEWRNVVFNSWRRNEQCISPTFRDLETKKADRTDRGSPGSKSALNFLRHPVRAELSDGKGEEWSLTF